MYPNSGGFAAHREGHGRRRADYDHDGRQDIFVANDTFYTFLFHNLGTKFEESAFPRVWHCRRRKFIGGMGLDFRDFDNDGSQISAMSP